MKRYSKLVKTGVLLALAALALSGCVTSTVESRKKERSASYAALPPDAREVVDKGQIKPGLAMDAVYIAWGKPAEVLKGESPTGPTVTWIYLGTAMQEYRYWNYRYYGYGYRWSPEPFLDYDYYPRRYVRGEVVFEGGVVTSWRNAAGPYH